jgi:hypothetical protein
MNTLKMIINKMIHTLKDTLIQTALANEYAAPPAFLSACSFAQRLTPPQSQPRQERIHGQRVARDPDSGAMRFFL